MGGRHYLVALMLAAAAEQAMAQLSTADHGGFALKPRLAFSMRAVPAEPRQRPARIYAIDLSPIPAEPAAMRMAVERRRQLYAGVRAMRSEGLGAPARNGTDIAPRTSLTMIDARFDLPLGRLAADDRLSATLGWQGAKISNRSANATSQLTRDNLRAKDWFLPVAQMRFGVMPRLALSADYREAMWAYGDSGAIGAMGLDREGFRTLRNALRPERDRRARLGLDWAAGPGVAVRVAAYAARIEDRMGFARGSYAPLNLGSADVRGLDAAVTHSLSPALRWTARYAQAAVRADAGEQAMERKLALSGEWRAGPWRCAMGIARTSAPALGQEAGAGTRFEAGMDYDAGGPRIGLRLTDPDRLSASRLGEAMPTGPARAAEQARAVMLTAAFSL
ncbi:MAG: TonB-dependent receptor [Pseudomonadota bacterium]|uniref:TonB-dependent receptor n=1 Tax=Sphingobium sp. TaxID=1912891 RepID=UPI002E24A358